MTQTSYKIVMRTRQLVNTDPQRRCYNGCHFSSELVWGPWVDLQYGIENSEKGEEHLNSWRDLNDFAVSQRGESAKKEFKLVEED